MTDRGLIRPARRDDAAALLALEALFPSDRMSLRSIRRFIASAGTLVLVAERGGEVVGDTIFLTRRGSRTARLYSLAVAPSARGQRLAERLVLAAEDGARARGLDTMLMEVRADNAIARRLYAKLGYEELASLPAFYDDGADGLRLGKRLSETE